MTYDAKVPLSLKSTQQWFGSIIGRPIDHESRINPITPSGNPIEDEAGIYIQPSPTLRPAQRIQIYNQQYWWRLLNVLHDTYPLVTRLFGYDDFNQTIGMPFLEKCAPNHWSLTLMGSRLPEWISTDYHANDQELILDAANVDWAYNYSFVVEGEEPITLETLPTPGDPSSLLAHKLFLQPYVFIFDLRYDLMEFRSEFLKKEPEYWLENDFPSLKKDRRYYFMCGRNQHNGIFTKELSFAEYHILKEFKDGSTVENVCAWIEEQTPEIHKEAMDNLPRWFQEWIIQRWLTLKHI